MEIFRMSHPPTPPKGFLVPKVLEGGDDGVAIHIHVPKKIGN